MVLTHGDCLTELVQLKEDSIDACVTDPPYGIGFAGHRWDRFGPQEFARFTLNWGEQVRRVLRPGGYVVAFGGNPLFLVVQGTLREVGLTPLGIFLWSYRTGVPKTKLDLKPAFEPAVIARKPPFVDDPWPTNVFSCEKPNLDELEAGCADLPLRLKTTFGVAKTPRHNPHPTVKPVKLMRLLVRLACPSGGTVLDPFIGSGSTGMACVYEGRNFVGIERDADYHRIATRRVAYAACLAAAGA